ncbi:MAG: DMT family transporter [Acutalibacteraceae bacterium]
MGSSKQRNPHYMGIICIIISAFCFAFMNLFVRLSGDLPSVQKSFFRNFVAVFFALLILLKERKSFHFQKSNLKFLILRSLFGTIGILGNFYAIDHLVLSDASMLNKMSPFFAILFSFFLLKEKLTPVQIIAVGTAFLGSMMIVKPTFQNMDILASLSGLMSGMAAGIAYTFVRMLGQRGENGAFIVFFFSAFSCIFTLPFLIFDFHPMTLEQTLCLLGAGLAATGGQFAITKAYCYAPAKEISVYDYSQIIFAALLGFVILGEVPDVWSFVGYIVICGTAVAMFIYNNKKHLLKK